MRLFKCAISDRSSACQLLIRDPSGITTNVWPRKGAALGRADLILSPAIGAFEAKNVVKGINEYLVEPDNVLGLIPGCRAGAADLPATRTAFGNISMLKTELPWSEAIGDQVVNSDIRQFTASLACEQFGTGYTCDPCRHFALWSTSQVPLMPFPLDKPQNFGY